MERGHAGEIYNLGGGHEMNNLDLTHHILYAFGKNDESIQYVQDRPAHDFRYSLNTLKLKKLGFEIQPKFETHLKETIEWYRAHRSWWEPLKTDTYTLK